MVALPPIGRQVDRSYDDRELGGSDNLADEYARLDRLDAADHCNSSRKFFSTIGCTMARSLGKICNAGNPEYIPQEMLPFSPGHGKKEIAENCRQCGETIANFPVHILIPSDCKSLSPSEKRGH